MCRLTGQKAPQEAVATSGSDGRLYSMRHVRQPVCIKCLQTSRCGQSFTALHWCRSNHVLARWCGGSAGKRGRIVVERAEGKRGRRTLHGYACKAGEGDGEDEQPEGPVLAPHQALAVELDVVGLVRGYVPLVPEPRAELER